MRGISYGITLTLSAMLGAIALFTPARLEACTGITLTAENGDVVYGRTLEWGTFDLKSRIFFYPRNFHYQADMPKGMSGMKWTGRYGVAGLDALNKGCLIDGMNETGLTAGLFYHPGFAEYVDWTGKDADRALAPTDVLNYILSTCSTVAEVRKALTDAVVVNVKEEELGFPAPIHIIVTEPGGNQLIVEWTDGKTRFYTSKVGVITNAPNYDWHLTNLRNYLDLTSKPHQDIDLGKIKLSPLGGGSGMLGLPGDFTPPSRFIRAVAFSATARPLPNGEEGIYEAFRILDNFNVPLGAAEGGGKSASKGMRSATIWTIAHDQANRKFFYHTQNDRQLQGVDLQKIDFSAFDKPFALPLDNGKQSVKDRTPKLPE